MFIVIGGATATGKSALAIRLAQELDGEIISADSMQIYRGMNIGTAKITPNEMNGIKHHMIDIIDPFESFSLAEFTDRATACIENITNNGKLPIICGGTGLYINALIYGYNLSSYNESLRKQLIAELNDKGIDYMYEKLITLDPLAVSIHKNNIKRVIRALEAIIGDEKSILAKEDKKQAKPHLMYAIDVPREILYDNINKRVDLMFEQGLVDEVNQLIKQYKLDFDMQSMQAIGYKEFNEYLDKKINMETLKYNIKKHSRNYAKRQLTWFKHIPTCKWLNFVDYDRLLSIIKCDYSKYITNLK